MKQYLKKTIYNNHANYFNVRWNALVYQTLGTNNVGVAVFSGRLLQSSLCTWTETATANSRTVSLPSALQSLLLFSLLLNGSRKVTARVGSRRYYWCYLKSRDGEIGLREIELLFLL